MVNGKLSFEKRLQILTWRSVGRSATSRFTAMAWFEEAWSARGLLGTAKICTATTRSRRRVMRDLRVWNKAENCLAARKGVRFLGNGGPGAECAYEQALRRVEGRKPALEIGLEILDILQPDVEPQGRAARRPLGGGAIARAVEWNDQALEAAP